MRPSCRRPSGVLRTMLRKPGMPPALPSRGRRATRPPGIPGRSVGSAVRKQDVAQAERPEDGPVQLLAEGPVAGRLHDQAEQDVAGVGVRPGRARREARRLVGDHGDQGLGRPGTQAARPEGVQLLSRGWPCDGARAGVIEQLAEADLLAVGQAPGQPALQGVRQRQAALRGQSQDDGGDQRLGQPPAGPAAAAARSRAPRGAAPGSSPVLQLAPCHNETGIPTRSSAAGGRLQLVGLDARSCQKPRDHRV
jgi:hypothetical protein